MLAHSALCRSWRHYVGRPFFCFATVLHAPYCIPVLQKYWHHLLGLIQAGKLDPSLVVTHVLPLEDAPRAYKIFNDKQEGCIKVRCAAVQDAPTSMHGVEACRAMLP